MLQRPLTPTSKIPEVSRRVATEAPGAQAAAAFDAPGWSLPRTIALVTAASAALWLTIVGLSRWLAGWLEASPIF